MRVAMFYHSLVSDWNHGNAHFLRGIATELASRGHEVRIFEPAAGWSRQNLLAEVGPSAIAAFHRAYPALTSSLYEPRTLDLDRALAGVDLVLVHEWSDHELVARLGRHRAYAGGYVLLFHDTHHRAVTEPASMERYDLRAFDGVLAFGEVLADIYRQTGWCERVWTWHEAADVHRFAPAPQVERRFDLVWIGNWGDGERTAELEEFLLAPVQSLGLSAVAYGVRYPEDAVARLAAAGIRYGGWLANHDVPRVMATARATVHVPRAPYVQRLPGIPTIRVFEALACGIPLVIARWRDDERLFSPGEDYLVADDGDAMTAHLGRIVADRRFAETLAAHGRRTILARHTCAHRVDELLRIYGQAREAAYYGGQ